MRFVMLLLVFLISLNIMQSTYRLKAQEISMDFLKSLKTLFAGQEVEITVKSVETGKNINIQNPKSDLLTMIKDSREHAPVISPDIDIRSIIDDAHNPAGN